jgi:hypothetical protein
VSGAPSPSAARNAVPRRRLWRGKAGAKSGRRVAAGSLAAAGARRSAADGAAERRKPRCASTWAALQLAARHRIVAACRVLRRLRSGLRRGRTHASAADVRAKGRGAIALCHAQHRFLAFPFGFVAYCV